jgi:hypothetical protein
MLTFLATLGVSAGAALLVQAMDIECANTAKRRPSRGRSHAIKSDASYPEGAALSGLQ